MKKPTDSFYYNVHEAVIYLMGFSDYMSRSMFELRGGIGASMEHCDLRALRMDELTKMENKLIEILEQIAFHRDLMPIIRSDIRMSIARLFFSVEKFMTLEIESNTFEDKCNGVEVERRCRLVLAAVQQRKRNILLDPYRS